MTDHRARMVAMARGGRADWYRLAASTEAESASFAELDLYDEIGGWWGTPASELVREIRALDVDEIRLHINSPGGSAFDGIAIMNALRQQKARVVVTVDALAASAASIVAMAGDEVVMALGSELMVHEAWAYCVGPAEDMRAVAESLDKLSDNLAGIYAEHAGGTVADWRDVMHAETWYTAEEAVTAGLASRVETSRGNDADAAAHFDLTVFAHAGRRDAPPPVIPKTPAARSGGSTPTERSVSVTFTDEQLAELRAEVGVPADADETTIIDGFKAALAARPAPSLPEGVVPIDSARLATLEADARLGAEARSQQLNDQRTALVTAAVNDGRIPKVRAEAWVKMLAADPGAADTLAAMTKGLVPIGEPLGHADDVDADVRETTAYKNWSM